jgi:endoglucanase
LKGRLSLAHLPLALSVLPGCGALFPQGGGGPRATPSESSGWVVHAVRVNTVGYLPGREKIATIVPPAGVTIPAGSSAAVYTMGGELARTCALVGPMIDPDSSATYYTADFTGLDAEGTYYLQISALAAPGSDGGVDSRSQSAPFAISRAAFDDALGLTMTGMYGQRCGTAVDITMAGDAWQHGACHQHDAYLDYLSKSDTADYPSAVTTGLPSLGGWHDAGDYGKYVTNGTFTVGMLLEAYEHFTAKLASLSLPIPEHGTTATGGTVPMPDFLWEVKWELDWLLTTQQPSGGVPHKLTALSFETFPIPPEGDSQKRYFTGIGTSATANFVAVMAQAARIYKSYAPTDAAKYLAAAELSWSFLAANAGPATPPDNSEFGTGAYGDASDADNRAWAAAELWETTGDAGALAQFESKTTDASVSENFDYDNVVNLGYFTYLLSKQPGRSPTVVAALTTSLKSTADALTEQAQTAAFGRDLAMYWWGSNGAVARTAMNLWVANQLTPSSAYLDTIAKAVDHLLGRNYYDRSQVTQLGYHPPVNPHHAPSALRNGDPWPGLLVGGANPTSSVSNPSDVDWVDNANDYDLNEIAINWNGALVYALAALASGQM